MATQAEIDQLIREWAPYHADPLPKCPHRCHGGWVDSTETDMFGFPVRKPCKCNLHRTWRKRLGDDIYYQPDIEDSPLIGRTGDNLWIKGHRALLLGHIRAAIMRQERGTMFRLRPVTDFDVREARFHSGQSVDEDGVAITGTTVYTSVTDLMDGPHLIILYLGVHRSSNKMLPDIISEALSIREYRNAPTWVVTPPAGFTGTPAYSKEVVAHIQAISGQRKPLEIGQQVPDADQITVGCATASEMQEALHTAKKRSS